MIGSKHSKRSPNRRRRAAAQHLRPELHLTLIHLLCAAVDDSLARGAFTDLDPIAGVAMGGFRDKEERPWP